MYLNVTTDLLNREYLEFMQYTGLKDKNDIEIYVGDIVRVKYEFSKGYLLGVDYKYETYPVYFNEHYLQFQFQREGYFVGYNLSPDCVKDYEVIGNIYMNP